MKNKKQDLQTLSTLQVEQFVEAPLNREEQGWYEELIGGRVVPISREKEKNSVQHCKIEFCHL